MEKTGRLAFLAAAAPLAFFEISACDTARLKTFYEGWLEWKLSAQSADVLSIEGAGVAGALVKDCRPTASAYDRIPVKLFVRVPEIEPALDRAKRLGADVVVPPSPAGKLRMAELRDPAGNAIGVVGEK